MNTLTNTLDIHTTNYLKDYTGGKFRYIIKCPAGFMTVVDAQPSDNVRYFQDPNRLFNKFKPGSLHAIEFCPTGGNYYLTVFARVGKKIKLVDEKILTSLTVDTIKRQWPNTGLMELASHFNSKCDKLDD